MEHQSNIMYRDPELEASFSFSGYDLITNSPDDLCDDDDQYIEIELQQPRSNKHHEYYDDHGLDLDLEFRISFSSSKSVPNFLQLSYNNNNGALSRTTTVDSLGSDSIETVTTPSSSTLSCSSSADTYWAAASPTTSTQPPSKWKVQFRAVNRLLSSFLSIPRTPSEMEEKSQQVSIYTRTLQKITKTTSGGIMMKLLIKCRSINIRTLLSSLVKPYQIIINNAPLQSSGGQNKKKKKWLVQRDHNNIINGDDDDHQRSSRVFEMMNMDAIRGVLESMSITSLGRRRDNKIKQSISSSPIKAGGNPTDNSIQSAIAHCKTSFGQPSDFCF
ncbi:hypothetical protein Dsin_017558 [Dipteronia sinensis]|uniref:Uncharacterized protein n=1 Tax=Dipteronia sinensis TaxID=43782 RepID=A0AAE0AGK1_9ROSI|nr:hypothetical protein Dsin_017558 [Dipteronia sinensis]